MLDLSQAHLTTLIRRGDVLSMTKAIIGLGNSYYPETIFKIFVVNAPFVFRSAYALASPFIHPVTRDKIRICGGPSRFLPEMASAGIPPTEVPRALGGQHVGRPIADVIAAFAAADRGEQAAATAVQVRQF